MNPAEACLACAAAEDAYDAAGADAAPLEVPLDPRLEKRGWSICGHLTAVDAFLRTAASPIDQRRRWYGWVLSRKVSSSERTQRSGAQAQPGEEFLGVVRGTDGAAEWLEDFEGLPCKTPQFPGEVEDGFLGIYDTLQYRAPGASETPLLPGIKGAAGAGDSPVTIAGHSLGAALATYLAYELAAPEVLGARVAGRFFASPHPGDSRFAAAFAARCPDHRMWRNVRDLVPRVPFALGYCALPNVTELAPGDNGVLVEDSPGCNHHALVYLSLIDKEEGRAACTPALDAPYFACLTFAEHPEK